MKNEIKETQDGIIEITMTLSAREVMEQYDLEPCRIDQILLDMATQMTSTWLLDRWLGVPIHEYD